MRLVMTTARTIAEKASAVSARVLAPFESGASKRFPSDADFRNAMKAGGVRLPKRLDDLHALIRELDRVMSRGRSLEASAGVWALLNDAVEAMHRVPKDGLEAAAVLTLIHEASDINGTADGVLPWVWVNLSRREELRSNVQTFMDRQDQAEADDRKTALADSVKRWRAQA